jgi:hypothetical protein
LCLDDQFAFQPRKNAGTVHLTGDDYVFASRSELLGNLACAFGRAQEQEPKIVGMMFDKLSAKCQSRQLKSAILASRQEWAKINRNQWFVLLHQLDDMSRQQAAPAAKLSARMKTINLHDLKRNGREKTQNTQKRIGGILVSKRADGSLC